MKVLTILLIFTLFLTGNFKEDLKRLQDCNTLNYIISEYRDSSKQMTNYQKRLRDTLIPWYRKNCRA